MRAAAAGLLVLAGCREGEPPGSRMLPMESWTMAVVGPADGGTAVQAKTADGEEMMVESGARVMVVSDIRGADDPGRGVTVYARPDSLWRRDLFTAEIPAGSRVAVVVPRYQMRPAR